MCRSSEGRFCSSPIQGGFTLRGENLREDFELTRRTNQEDLATLMTAEQGKPLTHLCGASGDGLRCALNPSYGY